MTPHIRAAATLVGAAVDADDDDNITTIIAAWRVTERAYSGRACTRRLLSSARDPRVALSPWAKPCPHFRRHNEQNLAPPGSGEPLTLKGAPSPPRKDTP